MEASRLLNLLKSGGTQKVSKLILSLTICSNRSWVSWSWFVSYGDQRQRTVVKQSREQVDREITSSEDQVMSMHNFTLKSKSYLRLLCQIGVQRKPNTWSSCHFCSFWEHKWVYGSLMWMVKLSKQSLRETSLNFVIE